MSLVFQTDVPPAGSMDFFRYESVNREKVIMAKFCSDCGAKLNETNCACGYCGTPAAGMPTGNYGRSTPVMTRKNPNGTIKDMAVLVVVVVVVLFAILLITSSRGGKNSVGKWK